MSSLADTCSVTTPGDPLLALVPRASITHLRGSRPSSRSDRCPRRPPARSSRVGTIDVRARLLVELAPELHERPVSRRENARSRRSARRPWRRFSRSMSSFGSASPGGDVRARGLEPHRAVETPEALRARAGRRSSRRRWRPTCGRPCRAAPRRPPLSPSPPPQPPQPATSSAASKRAPRQRGVTKMGLLGWRIACVADEDGAG